MYDIIGDIHGYATKLKQLLMIMDYTETKNGWAHPNRKVIFVGDYIDRGPEIRETLQIIKKMVDNGNAYAIMGNHEYNALAYHHQLPDGSFIRSHNKRHTSLHQATIDQFNDLQDEWKEWLQWFYTLPVFLELDELRAVHACWDSSHINTLKTSLAGTNGSLLTPEFLVFSYTEESDQYAVVVETLKGKEFPLPEEHYWFNKDGFKRTRNRKKWWVHNPGTYGDYLIDCPEGLKTTTLDVQGFVYGAKDLPVFFGHYWMNGVPEVLADNIVCLDYSVALNGKLVAYRFNGESKVNNKNFIYV